MARAPINPVALVWAREVSHVSVEELAQAVNVKRSKVEEFESGETLPTFRQLTLLATKLDRPLGFFFAPPPSDSDVPETADFRGRGVDDLPSNLAKEMRRAEQHRDTILSLEGKPERRLESGTIGWNNLAVRAAEIRKQFGLTDTFVPPEAGIGQVFNFWRGLLENRGILVFQTTKIPLETFRGLSVHHIDLPIILVNGGDSPAGKTFTIFHELAHLINRTSGLCALHDFIDEEAVANNFAANFLMPEAAVRRIVKQKSEPLEAVEQLAKYFKVSTLAAAVRLRRLHLIGDENLNQVKVISEEKWDRAREASKQKEGFVPPWRLRYRDLGATYIGTVARAIEDQRVDLVDATYLLNARLPLVEQILEEYYRTGGTQ